MLTLSTIYEAFDRGGGRIKLRINFSDIVEVLF